MILQNGPLSTHPLYQTVEFHQHLLLRHGRLMVGDLVEDGAREVVGDQEEEEVLVDQDVGEVSFSSFAFNSLLCQPHPSLSSPTLIVSLQSSHDQRLHHFRYHSDLQPRRTQKSHFPPNFPALDETTILPTSPSSHPPSLILPHRSERPRPLG